MGLPEPVYDVDGITVYHGDCLELLPHLPAVDAVVTDPPYGVGAKTNYRSKGRSGLATCNDFAPVLGDDEPFDPSPWLGFPKVVLFGANHYASRLPDRSCWLVWDKRDGDTSNDNADCEMAWTNLRTPARLFGHRWKGMIRASEQKAPRVHPTQKPVALMRWCLDTIGVPNDALVLDPYAGSGTTGVACAKTGRRCILIEKDPRYIPIIIRRLREAETPLFATHPEG